MKKNVIRAAAMAIAFSAALSACGAAEPVPAETTDTMTETTASEVSVQTETPAEETTAETSSETETETTSETETETETITETEAPVSELNAGEDPMLDELYSVNRSNAEKLYANSIAKVYSFDSAAGLEPLSQTNTSDTFSARLWTYMGGCKELSFTMLRKDSELITDKGLLLGTWVGVDDEGAAIIGGKPAMTGVTILHYGKEISDHDTLIKAAKENLVENGYSDEEAEELLSAAEPLRDHFVYSPVYIQPFYDDEGYACIHLADENNTDTRFAQVRIAVSDNGYAALMSPDIGAFYPSVCSQKEISDEDFSSWSYGFLETDSVYYPLAKPLGNNIRICDAAPDPDYDLTMDEFSSSYSNDCLLGAWVNGVSCY
ncbi:MAG: hypothetical protein ACI4J0_01500 [Huintestinicola sp.]|uniref:hypothetical protein n=1 Tax=Huintestinicola sp. TaxID=2981661 RepID=UPI003F02D2B3